MRKKKLYPKLLPLLLLLGIQPVAAQQLDEIVVTSQRRDSSHWLHKGNIERISGTQISKGGHQHISELLLRVPGTWINRGSGQEHLTAIRSPVLTGAGACGAFLMLEDGIPVRPSSFCNMNQLLELNTEQAAAIEVIRGPGSALYGSNALHGIINVLLPTPGPDLITKGAIEFGSDDYYRARATLVLGEHNDSLLQGVINKDTGFRLNSGHQQGKFNFKTRTQLLGGDLLTTVSISDLDQQTAGFVQGEDAYRDTVLRQSNENPDAYRNANSQRLHARWQRTLDNGLEIDLRPYVRRSAMNFLQHFLPGQPIEKNGHVSAGALMAVGWLSGDSRWTLGGDLEWSDVELQEYQIEPTTGSAFLVETRPPGKHYDYRVESFGLAPYLHLERELSESLTINAGLRLEFLNHRYDNRMLDGNTRDDGSVCGFGGCLYSRPADRSDHFFNLTPKFGFSYSLNNQWLTFGSLARGFRAPQSTEQYRLQNGQLSAELDSEWLDSIELGFRFRNSDWYAENSVFLMRKQHSVYRDAEGFNVSDAKTRHMGIEWSMGGPLSDVLQMRLNGSYAIHQYDFDRVANRGETFVSGNDVDTAPRWQGSAEIEWNPAGSSHIALQWIYLGHYYVDAMNQFDYPGHQIWNLRGQFALSEHFSLTLRLKNLANKDYADRADYAFGNFRYFPGHPREAFIELSWVK